MAAPPPTETVGRIATSFKDKDNRSRWQQIWRESKKGTQSTSLKVVDYVKYFAVSLSLSLKLLTYCSKNPVIIRLITSEMNKLDIVIRRENK